MTPVAYVWNVNIRDRQEVVEDVPGERGQEEKGRDRERAPGHERPAARRAAQAESNTYHGAMGDNRSKTMSLKLSGPLNTAFNSAHFGNFPDK